MAVTSGAEQRPSPEAAGDDQKVDRRRIAPGVGGHHLQAADRSDQLARTSDREHAERGAVVRAPRVDATDKPGA